MSETRCYQNILPLVTVTLGFPLVMESIDTLAVWLADAGLEESESTHWNCTSKFRCS